MLRIKYLAVILLSIFLTGCTSEKPNFTINTSAKNNTVVLGESVKLSLHNPEGVSVNSITYLLDGKPVTERLKLDNKLGKQDLIAKVVTGNDTIIATSNLIVLNNKRPQLYTYEIVNTYAHDATSYTQGLEFYKGELYESTGQFGESKLRKVDYKTGAVLKNLNLTSGYFAEGLTKPLLINAPMVDDNVFFEDTVRLVQRLIELEKQDFETAIYPVEPHGFVQPSSWLNEYRRIYKLFENTL